MSTNLSLQDKIIPMECALMNYRYPLYGWQKVLHLAFPVCFALMWIPSAFLNFVALLVYASKDIRKRISNFFILNTIIADLLTGLFVIPLAMLHYSLIAYFHKIECLILEVKYFGFTFSVLSFFMVTLSAVDRYVAVFIPYFYSTTLSHWSTLYYVIVAITWIISITSVTITYVESSFKPTLYCIGVLLLMNIYINLKLWLAVRRIRKAIHGQCQLVLNPILSHGNTSKDDTSIHDTNKVNMADTQTRKLPQNDRTRHQEVSDKNRTSKTADADDVFSCQHDGNNTATNVHTSSNKEVMKEISSKQLYKEHARSNRVLLLILISLCICYLPYFITILIMKGNKDSDELCTVRSIGLLMCFLKSVLNPIIYWYSMPSIRRRMKALLLCQKHNQIDFGTNSRNT